MPRGRNSVEQILFKSFGFPFCKSCAASALLRLATIGRTCSRACVQAFCHTLPHNRVAAAEAWQSLKTVLCVVDKCGVPHNLLTLLFESVTDFVALCAIYPPPPPVLTPINVLSL